MWPCKNFVLTQWCFSINLITVCCVCSLCHCLAKSVQKFSVQMIIHYCMVVRAKHLSHNLTGSLLMGYQEVSLNLTIFEIETVNIENEFCLEGTISVILGLFCASSQYLCILIQVNFRFFFISI